MGKGKISKLKKYADKEKNEVFVACFSQFSKDVAYMLEELGKLVNEVELNGYFQHVVNIFDVADEEETKKSKHPTSYRRALSMAFPITFPHLIESDFDTDACVKAILERLPLAGGIWKPRKKRGKKRGCSPPLSKSEIDEIQRVVLGSDEELQSDQGSQ